MNPEPFRFAARAALAAAALGAVVLAADRSIVLAFEHGVRLVPALPPGAPLPPRELFEIAAAGGRVAVLGDSVVTYVPRGEPDAASLYALIAREVPAGAAAADLSRGGRGVRLIAAQVSAMRRFGLHPRAVVLVLNLREFSPTCALNPYQRQDEISRMLETGSFLPVRAAAVFKHRFGTPSAEEFLSTQVRVGGVPVGTVRDVERPRGWFEDDDGAPASIGRTRSLVRYAFDMDRSVHLEALRAAIAGIREERVPVVLVVAPIDVEYLRAHLSAAEMHAVERNVDALREALSLPGTQWLDLSGALPADRFSHPPLNPDEHLRSQGRHLVASRVGEVLRAALAH